MDDDRKRVIAEAKAHIDGSWSPERFPPRSEPMASSPVRRTDQIDGLTYKVTENALAPPAEALQQPAASDDWNAWLTRELDARLDVERQLMIEVVGEVVAKLRAERDGEQSAETAREFAKIWKSLTEAHRSIVEIRQERVTQGFREVASDPAKKMN